MKRALLLSVLIAAPLAAQDAAPFRVDQSGKAYWRLQDAVNAIGGGEGSISIAPGTYEDCAVQKEGDILFRAAQPGSVIFDGYTCDDKAALVLGGHSARIEGLIFQNMKVPDGNGAGIRLQGGDLDVVNSIFRNSEQGILTGALQGSNVRIDRVTFSGLGGCPDSGCSHSIYIGDIASLTVTRSRFERGTGGHYVKSRSTRVTIADNSFDDTRGKATNYMIDLPAGSVGEILRNTFVQGPNKENHSAFIAVGAEDRLHPSAGLVIADNDASIAPGVTWPTNFVADWTREPLKLGANRLGQGIKPFTRR